MRMHACKTGRRSRAGRRRLDRCGIRKLVQRGLDSAEFDRWYDESWTVAEFVSWFNEGWTRRSGRRGRLGEVTNAGRPAAYSRHQKRCRPWSGRPVLLPPPLFPRFARGGGGLPARGPGRAAFGGRVPPARLAGPATRSASCLAPPFAAGRPAPRGGGRRGGRRAGRSPCPARSRSPGPSLPGSLGAGHPCPATTGPAPRPCGPPTRWP